MLAVIRNPFQPNFHATRNKWIAGRIFRCYGHVIEGMSLVIHSRFLLVDEFVHPCFNTIDAAASIRFQTCLLSLDPSLERARAFSRSQ